MDCHGPFFPSSGTANLPTSSCSDSPRILWHFLHCSSGKLWTCVQQNGATTFPPPQTCHTTGSSFSCVCVCVICVFVWFVWFVWFVCVVCTCMRPVNECVYECVCVCAVRAVRAVREPSISRPPPPVSLACLVWMHVGEQLSGAAKGERGQKKNKSAIRVVDGVSRDGHSCRGQVHQRLSLVVSCRLAPDLNLKLVCSFLLLSFGILLAAGPFFS